MRSRIVNFSKGGNSNSPRGRFSKQQQNGIHL
jgi:hypothetical protein